MLFFFRKLIQRTLKLCAKIYLFRVNPRVIVIAGTTNRHWIKENVLEAMRKEKLTARGNKKNFNAEIGLPLSILGLHPDEQEKSKLERWLKIILKALLIAVYSGRHARYIEHLARYSDKQTKYLVLEMAIDKPDDMAYLLSIVKPHTAIFTTITMIYPENFSGLDEIAKEYKKLIAALSQKGIAILNADDERIYSLKEKALCSVISYGIVNQQADYLAKDITKVADGQEFKIQTPELDIETIKLYRFGVHHVYAELAKKAVAEQLF